MADIIIRLVAAFAYSKGVYVKMKYSEQKEAELQLDRLKDESKKDLQSPSDFLLPLRGTKITPETQISQLIKLCKLKTDKYIKNKIQIEHELLYVYIALTLLILTAIIGFALNLAWVSIGLLSMLIRKTIELALVVYLISCLNRPKAPDIPLKNHLTTYSAALLIIAELIELQQQYDKNGELAVLSEFSEHTSPFSLFTLTFYMLSFAFVCDMVRLFKSTQLKERVFVRKQSIINKIAVCLFQESKQNSGYAIMHFDQNDNSDAKITLLRFNEHFVKLLTENINIENELASLNQPYQSEADKEKITNRLLDEYREKNEHAYSDDNDLTFRKKFIKSIKAYTKATENSASIFEQQAKVQVLFTQEFFSGRESRGILKQKILNGLEISVQILCTESSLFLVKVNKLTLARLQIPHLSAVKVEEDKQSFKAVNRDKRKKSPKKKVSFDNYTTGGQRLIQRVPPRRTVMSSQSLPAAAKSNLFQTVHSLLLQEKQESTNKLLPQLQNQAHESSFLTAKEPKVKSLSPVNVKRKRSAQKSVFTSQINLDAVNRNVVNTLLAQNNTNEDSSPSNLAKEIPVFQNMSLGDPKQKQRREVIFDAIGLNPTPSYQSSLDVNMVEKVSEPASADKEQKNPLAKQTQQQQQNEIQVKKQEEVKTSQSVKHSSKDFSSFANSVISKTEIQQQRHIISRRFNSLNLMNVQKAFPSSCLVSKKVTFKMSQDDFNAGLSQKSQKIAKSSKSLGNISLMLSKSLGIIPPMKKDFNEKVFSPIMEKQESNIQSPQQQQQKNSKIFVYKIIHDLRYPTQALSDGLGQIIKEIDFTVNISNRSIIEIKTMRYKGSDRIKKGIKVLQSFFGVSSIKKKLGKIKNCSKSQMDLKRFTKELSYDKSSIDRVKIERQKHFSADIYNKKRTISSCSKKKSSQKIKKQLNADNSSDENQRINNHRKTKSFDYKIKKFQQSFWELPMQNFEEKKNEKKQVKRIKTLGFQNQNKQVLGKKLSIPIAQQQVIEVSMSMEEDAIKDQQKIINPSHQSSSLEESDNETENDDVSEGIISIDTHEIKTPQGSKNMARKLLPQLMEEKNQQLQQKSSYKFYSLAVDRIIHQNDAKRRHSRQVLCKSQKLPRSQSESMKNVLKVIDSFYEASEDQKLSTVLSNQLRVFSTEVKKDLLLDKGQENSQHQLLEPSQKFIEPKNSNQQLRIQKFNNEADSSVSISSKEKVSQKFQLNSNTVRLVQSVMDERRLLINQIESNYKKQIVMSKQLKTMQGQVDMMLTLMRDLLDQAQLDNDTFTLVNNYFNLVQLVKHCKKMMLSRSSIKKVILKGPVFDNAMDKQYFQQVLGDENRYAQILLNFLSNAVKFTPADGTVSVLLKITELKELTITDHIEEQSHDQSPRSAPDKELLIDETQTEESKLWKEKLMSFQIVFRDTGCGISSENQKKLFMNFSKLQETQDANKQGVGLGLSICKEIIMANGGSVDIQSEEGKGTDFIISMQTKCRVDENQLNRRSLYRSQQSLSKKDSCVSSKSELANSDDNVTEEEEISSSMSEIRNSKISKSVSSELSEVSEQQEKDSSSSGIGGISNSKRPNRKSGVESFANLGLKNLRKSSDNYITNQLLSSITEKISADSKFQSSYAGQTRCLLANDNQFLLTSFEAGLTPHFDIIETAENGLEALEKVKAHPRTYFTAIVLDISMPIMDGMQACIAIKKYLNEAEEEEVPDNNSDTSKIKLMKLPQQANSDKNCQVKIQSEPKIPFLYALTSEIDEEVMTRIRQSGFKAIYHMLDQITIQEILQDAGHKYRPPDCKENSMDASLFGKLKSEDDQDFYQSSKSLSSASSQSATPMNRGKNLYSSSQEEIF